MKIKKADVIQAAYVAIVVSVFIVLPVVLLLLWQVPQIASISIDSDSPVSIKVGTADSDSNSVRYVRLGFCKQCGIGQAINIYLPCDFSPNGVRVNFNGENAHAVMRLMSIRRHFVLRDDYEFSYDGATYSCKRVGTYLSLPWFIWLLILTGEVGLIAAAVVMRKHVSQDKSALRVIFVSFFIALLFFAFVAMIVPIESIMANRSLYKFSLFEFLIISAKVVAVGTVMMGCGLYLSRKSFGYILHTLTLGILIYLYFRTGILSAGEPSIDGEVSYYCNNHPAEFLDVVALMAVGVASIFIYKYWRFKLHFVALGILTMVSASLLDVKKDRHATVTASPLAKGFCSKFDAAQSVVHSRNQNIIMVILDSVGEEVSKDVLKELPEIAKSFPGFVMFENNIGGHNFTEAGVPALLTGKLFDGGIHKGSFNDYGFSIFGPESVLMPYVERDIPTYCIPGSMMFGFAWPKTDVKRKQDSPEFESPYMYRPETTPPLNLFEIARFRMMPFFLKYKVLLMTLVGTDSHAGVKDEVSLYPILMAAPVRDDIPTTLQIVHTNGAHAPFDIDRDGNFTSIVRTSYDGHLDRACFAFKQAAKLMDEYRRKGIYDNSLIVITTDHGWMERRERENGEALHPRARTMLWVKSIGAKGPMKASKIPTSHVKVKDLICKSLDKKLTQEDVEACLHCEKRVFRALYSDYSEEWIVDADGNSTYKGIKE